MCQVANRRREREDLPLVSGARGCYSFSRRRKRMCCVLNGTRGEGKAQSVCLYHVCMQCRGRTAPQPPCLPLPGNRESACMHACSACQITGRSEAGEGNTQRDREIEKECRRSRQEIDASPTSPSLSLTHAGSDPESGFQTNGNFTHDAWRRQQRSKSGPQAKTTKNGNKRSV